MNFSKFKKKYKALRFRLSGATPWSAGYIEARDEIILQELGHPRWGPKKIPHGYGKGFDERVVEIPWLFKRLSNQESLVWDVGSVLNRAEILTQKKIQRKRIIISNLNPESKNFNLQNVSYLYEDCIHTCLKDGIFDEILCISTLEHIGFDNKKYTKILLPEKNKNLFLQAILIFKAKLKKGGKALITVPFGERRDHGWFQVFDQSMIRKLINTFSPQKSKVDVFKCTVEGWRFSDMNTCCHSVFHDWGKRTNQNINIAGSEAVACVELIK